MQLLILRRLLSKFFLFVYIHQLTQDHSCDFHLLHQGEEIHCRIGQTRCQEKRLLAGIYSFRSFTGLYDANRVVGLISYMK